jgi:Protein of unknown function DUF72
MHFSTRLQRFASPTRGDSVLKAPKEITHSFRLAGGGAALDAFLEQVSGLGSKLGPLLFQLPPSLAFDAQLAGSFFAALRKHFGGGVVCEPRHPGWFTAGAEDLMMEFRIGRVAANPPVVSAAAVPGGWTGLTYLRLHGSPRVYYSDYRPDQIESFAHPKRSSRLVHFRQHCGRRGDRKCARSSRARQSSLTSGGPRLWHLGAFVLAPGQAAMADRTETPDASSAHWARMASAAPLAESSCPRLY